MFSCKTSFSKAFLIKEKGEKTKKNLLIKILYYNDDNPSEDSKNLQKALINNLLLWGENPAPPNKSDLEKGFKLTFSLCKSVFIITLA